MICTIDFAHYARPAAVSKDMRELIGLFTQIALLRRGPQDLPASVLLLVLTILGYLCVNLLVNVALPPVKELPPLTSWLAQLLVGTLFTLAWYVVLLRLVRRPERTVQTATAVFGLQMVLSPLSVGFEWLMRRFGEDQTWEVPITSAGLLLIAWLIAANSHIVKAALDWSGMASVALVILEMLAGWLLLLAVFSPVKG
jgi:hypothetical protein